MKYGLGDYIKALSHDKLRRQGRFNQERIAFSLDMLVERLPQGARRCRQCAAVHGRYTCIPSAAVQNEWRHRSDQMDLFVHLLSCNCRGGARLQAMIVLENANKLHARSVYSCELLASELYPGPWTLGLQSEEAECDFLFPAEVEIISSVALPRTKQGASTNSDR